MRDASSKVSAVSRFTSLVKHFDTTGFLLREKSSCLCASDKERLWRDVREQAVAA